MTKIVINTCFGGFGLSDAAMHAYAARKGKTVYPEKNGFLATTYWAAPPEKRNDGHDELRICDFDIPRDDPDLVAVVEELGKKAAGDYAALKVVEIPDGAAWEIAEYDGLEHVAESHRTWG